MAHTASSQPSPSGLSQHHKPKEARVFKLPRPFFAAGLRPANCAKRVQKDGTRGGDGCGKCSGGAMATNGSRCRETADEGFVEEASARTCRQGDVGETVSLRTLCRGGEAEEASAKMRPRGRVAKDASARTRWRGRFAEDASPRMHHQGGVHEDTLARSRRRGCVTEKASSRRRRR